MEHCRVDSNSNCLVFISILSENKPQTPSTYKKIFNEIRALTRYHCFYSWNTLFQFMLESLDILPQSVKDDEIIIFDTG